MLPTNDYAPQVARDPTRGYRKKVVYFVLTEATPVATSIVGANPQVVGGDGGGGLTQYFIPGVGREGQHPNLKPLREAALI